MELVSVERSRGEPGWVVTALIGGPDYGYYSRRLYIGYTKRQAVQMFKDEHRISR